MGTTHTAPLLPPLKYASLLLRSATKAVQVGQNLSSTNPQRKMNMTSILQSPREVRSPEKVDYPEASSRLGTPVQLTLLPLANYSREQIGTHSRGWTGYVLLRIVRRRSRHQRIPARAGACGAACTLWSERPSLRSM
ncbi:hypothetical protein Mapa_009112 [Marchantia paleacea]|nr:hypothetical protein Mapa_009112 [Marchantia paleacea]